MMCVQTNKKRVFVVLFNKDAPVEWLINIAFPNVLESLNFTKPRVKPPLSYK